MIKIAMIDYDMSVTGGVEQVLTNLARALCDRFEIHVISLSRSGEHWQYEMPDSVKRVDLFEKPMRLRSLLLHGRKPIRWYVMKHRINLVMYFGHYTAYSMGRWLKRLPCRTVFCDHGAIMSPWNERVANRMRKSASRWADHTVVLTGQSQRAYEKCCPWTRGHISTIYNWIDPVFSEAAADYDADSRVLITVGRPTPQKGYDYLYQVAEELYKKTTDFSWELYGIEEEAIPEEIKSQKYYKNLRPMGMKDHMETRYGGHAMYVMTSRFEGLPLVLLEAKVNHLPIVSFDIVSGPSDIITDGEDGYLIGGYDVKEMAEKTAMLLADQNLRKNMSDKSGLRLELFDKNTITKEWEKLFRKVLRKKHEV